MAKQKQSKKSTASGDTQHLSKKNTTPIMSSDQIIDQLNFWSSSGTAEALEQLDKFLVTETNKELLDYARLVYGPAQFGYYIPWTEQEERDFELARLIEKREEHLWQLIAEDDRLEVEIIRLDMEEAVYNQLIKKQSKKTQEAWQYRYMGDMMGLREKRILLEQDITYETAWLTQARTMNKTKKYQHMPEDIFDHFELSQDGQYFWVDSMGMEEYEECDGLEKKERCCGCCSCDEQDDENWDRVIPEGDWKSGGEIRVEDIPF